MWALKTFHEKNWRESLHVQEFHHPPSFLWILAVTPGIQNTTGLPFFFVVFVFIWFWIFGWLGQQRVSSFYSFNKWTWHSYWIEVTFNSILSFSSLEEDLEQWLSCLESVLEVDESDPEDEFADKPGATIGTKFSVLQIIRIPSLMRWDFWPLIHS